MVSTWKSLNSQAISRALFITAIGSLLRRLTLTETLSDILIGLLSERAPVEPSSLCRVRAKPKPPSAVLHTQGVGLINS